MSNPNMDAGSKGLQINVAEGEPPIQVNATAGKVANLNADKLDGQEANSLLRVAQKAAEADTLDGINSAWFVRGSGRTQARARVIGGGIQEPVLRHSEGSPNIEVLYSCPFTPKDNGTLILVNLASETMNVFSDSGLQSPNAYTQLRSLSKLPAVHGGKRGAHNPSDAGARMATIEVFSVHRTSALGTSTDNRCHVQAQALFTFW